MTDPIDFAEQLKKAREAVANRSKTKKGFTRTRPPWWNSLHMSDKNKPMANAFNCMIVITQDPGICNGLTYDDMLHAPTLQHSLGDPDNTRGYPQPLSDDIVHAVQVWMQDMGLRNMSYKEVERGIYDHSRQHRYHPVREYLGSLTWDGQPRLDSWLAKYLGATQNAYVSAVGRWFLISMVSRIYSPGEKVDYMLVLEGDQGIEKSKALRALGGEWFSDNLPDIKDQSKDAQQHLRGKWLLEIPEMHAFSKAETSHLKSFLTRQEERFRPPYGRLDVFEKRQCVFAGTTNKDTYLKDETGGRRFWPIKCGAILVERLKSDRDQLFAEARERFLAHEPWWPDRDFEREFIAPEQTSRYEADIWEEPILEWLENRSGPLTSFRVACGALGYDDGNGIGDSHKTPFNRLGKLENNRIIAILKTAGWYSVRDKREAGTGRQLFYPPRNL